LVDIVRDTQIEGVVATNTTISREGLLASKTQIAQIGAGGLSGKILFNHATEVLSHLHQKSNGTIPLIGVGGIDSADKAEQKMKAGATLIQLYTGFIYKGPRLVKDIAKL